MVDTTDTRPEHIKEMSKQLAKASESGNDELREHVIKAMIKGFKKNLLHYQKMH